VEAEKKGISTSLEKNNKKKISWRRTEKKSIVGNFKVFLKGKNNGVDRDWKDQALPLVVLTEL